jgi:hypothetical protein
MFRAPVCESVEGVPKGWEEVVPWVMRRDDVGMLSARGRGRAWSIVVEDMRCDGAKEK